jgi:site-specific recombinase XerD
MPGRDTKTRFQGVFCRHQEHCRTTATGAPKVCNCTPSYYGIAWDAETGRHVRTRRFPRALEARDALADLWAALRKGEAPRQSVLTLGEARPRFLKAAREGVALNKWRRRYRPRAYEDLETALKHVPDEMARRRLDRVTRGEVQALIDQLSARGLSGSRVGSVVNALRSLYHWAQDRELTSRDPAQRVKLPASNPTVRDRVATPDEFANLLAALAKPTPKEREEEESRSPREALRDSVPFALAGYGTARRQEIRVLEWSHLNLDLGVMELAGDEEGRKPGGSWRIVPLVAPLLSTLRQEWLAQGRPKKGKVCPQSRRRGVDRVGLRQDRCRRACPTSPGLGEASRHTSAVG